MYHLVIDLEMCKVPKHYRTPKYKYANEMGDMWNLNNNEQNDIVGITPVPIMEKPKKTTKKKKKNHTKVNKRDNKNSCYPRRLVQ